MSDYPQHKQKPETPRPQSHISRIHDQPFGCYFSTTHSSLQTNRNVNRPLPGSAYHSVSAAVNPDVSPTSTSMSDDKDALERANASIESMIEALPLYPLLLTPLPHVQLFNNGRQSWEHEGTPFDGYELGRGLQYMTMVAQPPNRGITITQGGWVEEGLSPRANEVGSGTATPDVVKTRVKMSLADYKKVPKKTDEELEKAKALQAARRKEEEGQLNVRRSEHSRKRNAELQALAQRHDDSRALQQQPKTGLDKDRRKEDSLKRDAERAADARKKKEELDQNRYKLEQKEALSILKARHAEKDRAKAEPPAQEPTRKAVKNPTEPARPAKKLPPMLSPLAVEMEEDEIRARLPPLLSPTLPDEVEEALAQLKAKEEPRQVNSSNHANPKRAANAPGVARRVEKSKHKVLDELASDHESVVPRSIVKLKYGKSRRKDVERILNLRPRPTVEKKRPRDVQEEDAEAPPPKRTKQPLPSRENPPVASHRNLLATPKKGEAMARVSSTDSHGQARTPQGSTSTPKPVPTSTPSTVERPRINGVKPTSAPHIAAVETIETTKADFPRYQALGTVLKRSMDTILHSKMEVKPVVSAQDQKRAAIVGIECASAYMLSFSAFDKMRKLERKSNVIDNWDQFLVLTRFIHNICKEYPELRSAACLVVAATREVLTAHHMERLAAEPGPTLDAKFRTDIIRNSRDRVMAWESYAKETRALGASLVFPTTPVPEIVEGLIATLDAFASTNGVDWDKKIDV